VSTIYTGDLIANVRVTIDGNVFFMCSVLSTPQAYGSPTV